MRDNNKGGSGVPESTSGASAEIPREQIQAAESSGPGEPGDVDREDEERAERPISSDMQRFIGRQLRAVYDDVAKQPIPDRFLELMKQLEAKTSTG
jgi:hypothetical protein